MLNWWSSFCVCYGNDFNFSIGLRFRIRIWNQCISTIVKFTCCLQSTLTIPFSFKLYNIWFSIELFTIFAFAFIFHKWSFICEKGLIEMGIILFKYNLSIIIFNLFLNIKITLIKWVRFKQIILSRLFL